MLYSQQHRDKQTLDKIDTRLIVSVDLTDGLVHHLIHYLLSSDIVCVIHIYLME